MESVFKISEIPEQETVFSYLRKQVPFEEACRNVQPKNDYSSRVELKLHTEVEPILREVQSIINEKGFFGWRSKEGVSSKYGGFSLTYNPQHQDGLDPHVSTMGTPKKDTGTFSWGMTQEGGHRKNSYMDGYGFRVRTPASKQGALGAFLDTFQRSMIRSRVGVVVGSYAFNANEGWHRDEPVFMNLRVNIPLQSDTPYLFQMEGEDPYHLDVEKVYSWDTHNAHRVFCNGTSDIMRIHLVIGVAPWFDYIPEEDAWAQNEFFGKIHPFDMLAEGLITPLVHS